MDRDEMEPEPCDLLRAAFGEPPHQVTVAAVRRRMVRRRAMEAVAGTAAVAAVTPIRTATNTALPPIKVGATPVAIAITP